MTRIHFTFYISITVILSGLYLQSFKPAPQVSNDRSRLADEIERSIQTEMLNKWYPQCIDRQYGGFLSTFTYDWKPTGNQEKMIVTQARHTWSNARASELYPGVQYYKNGAEHGFVFLRDVMWDKTYGGFFTLVDRQGHANKNSVAVKDAYGNAFAMFALANYYRSSGDTSALSLAKKTFQWLESHSHDPVHLGYFQHLNQAGTPIRRDGHVPSTSDLGYKDQNSSIHLLEALTALYDVWPDSLLRIRLQEMLFLIRDTITTAKGDLTLFFQPDWTPVSFRDSSKEVILKHRNLDHVSFGHDIETAYLMLETSEALGLKNDSTTMRIAKKMVDHALVNGWDSQVGGFYDEGYYFKDSAQITIIRDSKNWWAQAEGLNSLLLMADHFPDDQLQYFQKFKVQWNYIQKFLIDHEHGGWYSGGLDKEPEQKTALKGNIWKGNYHQFRALSNCVQRLRPDTIPPSVPGNLHISKAGTAIILKWSPASDNRNLAGYNIYKNGIKTGFTPVTTYFVKEVQKTKSDHFFIKSVDFQGNESGQSNPSME